MKVNFKRFPVYADIRKEIVIEQDISFVLSNGIYTHIGGIMAHAVAMKIYNSDGEIELTDEETLALNGWAKMFVGVIADSLCDYISKNK